MSMYIRSIYLLYIYIYLWYGMAWHGMGMSVCVCLWVKHGETNVLSTGMHIVT